MEIYFIPNSSQMTRRNSTSAPPARSTDLILREWSVNDEEKFRIFPKMLLPI